MPIHEYFCEDCKKRFEEYTAHTLEADRGKCPRCSGRNTGRVISRFRVGGQGDLRETTQHGCHDHHVHGPNCNHGSSDASSDE